MAEHWIAIILPPVPPLCMPTQELVKDIVLSPADFVNNVSEAGQGVPAHEPPTPAGSVPDWAAASVQMLQQKEGCEVRAQWAE